MPQPHQQLLTGAIEQDAQAQRALLADDRDAARAAFEAAAELYRRSWEESPPRSYGRLVGVLKSSILAGDSSEAAAYVREALPDREAAEKSATASYARALAALALRDDADARRWSDAMATGGRAFERTARAIAALAVRDRRAYQATLDEIVRDFERRQDHLTGVAIADTALMLQRLAADRGMAGRSESSLLP